ncbi:MAG: signal recognition particle protein [Spiroplasma sp.]|nr:signal recognition particle protein [Mycoplasmatales bacterium]
MLNFLSEQIQKKFDSIGRKTILTEEDLKTALRDIRLILVEADVNYKVAKEFCKTIEAKALEEDSKILKGLNPGEQVIKLVKDQILELLKGDNGLILTNNIIMMVGLQGSGKTTSTGKIAAYLRKKKQVKNPLLVACDVYRPAAIEQLKTLGKQLDIAVYSEDHKNVNLIAANAVKYAAENGNDLIILDTAGRMHVDVEMMEEIKKLQLDFAPSETLLVVDGSTGQLAVDIANQFSEYVNITGLVFTKMDSDTRGGAILSVKKATNIDIKFLGISEKMDGLEEFNPERVVGRILGQGDVLGLIEKAEMYSEEMDMETTAQRMMEGKFDFDDFLKQMKMMKKMGGLNSIMGMMPGMKKIDTSMVDDNELKRMQAIIESMTNKERKNPALLNGKRRIRIANGSGTSVQQVNKLVKGYEQSKKMMKQMKNMDITQLNKMLK